MKEETLRASAQGKDHDKAWFGHGFQWAQMLELANGFLFRFF
jgi:hypothetical protein